MDQEQHLAPALAACTEEERQEAMGRFAVLRPHLNDGVPLPEAARVPVSRSDPFSVGWPDTAPPGWLA